MNEKLLQEKIDQILDILEGLTISDAEKILSRVTTCITAPLRTNSEESKKYYESRYLDESDSDS